MYPESKKKFDENLFRNPTSEYRGSPFWGWNAHLDSKILLKEIGDFKAMGMGGAHIHCRIGLDTPYLGQDFFDKVRLCKNKMKEDGLLCRLYDEDRWPSGSAGGIVTRETKYRTRFLVFSPEGFSETQTGTYTATAKAVWSNIRKRIGRYAVVLDSKGFLERYQLLKDNESPALLQETGDMLSIWEAWMEVSGDTPWFNNQAYVNTLDKKAIDRFIEVTYEEYYKHFGKDFGKEIPSIFSDEPQTTLKEVLDSPFEKKEVIFPFTDDFDKSFFEEYGESIIAKLPELVWELPDGEKSVTRYHYHCHVVKRFSEAFTDNIGRWCMAHNIDYTGHMLNEWTLQSQTMAVGEAMRPLKNFTIPGVDMLCDRRELSTVKQAESIAHQMGRTGVMSELYGVTGWDFDFRNHKLQGDWQAALGVTLRVPHLSWMSMEGEAKRDYPASIGYQSPWYKEYPVIEDHFARLNTVLTRGQNAVQVAVIHPIESYWICWGNRRQTALERQVLENNFKEVIEDLLFGLIDFDFISESVLEEEKKAQNGNKFSVGKMGYSVVVVPGCLTLRRTTYERLLDFHNRGGEVIFAGTIPSYIDAVPSMLPQKLANLCTCIDLNKRDLLNTLEKYRQIDVESRAVDGTDPTRMKFFDSGSRATNIFYQLRNDFEDKWLFLCHVNRPVNDHVTFTEEDRIKIKGKYKPIYYNTLDGTHFSAPCKYENGWTVITAYTSAHDSLLFRLRPLNWSDERHADTCDFSEHDGNNEVFIYHKPEYKHYLSQPYSYQMEELNCLLLDQAEYAFDDGKWHESDELLRIDNIFRKILGYPLRTEALAQPWTIKEKTIEGHLLKLRFRIVSEVNLSNLFLAMEHPEKVDIWLNDEKIFYQDAGWYVDESIRKIKVPDFMRGENILEVHIPFGRKTNVEWMYILGEFGTKIAGRQASMMSRPDKILWGDYVHQGLGFYPGNLVYTSEARTESGNLWIEVNHYRGALLKVQVDDGKWKNIIFAPYRVCLGHVEAGPHQIRIKIFGNRINAFGAVHNADISEKWYGPNLWRTEGSKWSYEYQLKETGVLTTPVIWTE